MPILVEIAAGELIDKITILEIKLDQIGAADKRANIRREYEQLTAVLQEHVPPSDRLTQLTAALQSRQSGTLAHRGRYSSLRADQGFRT